MEKAGFTTTKSEFVDAPVINELPVALECELIKVLEGSMYFAKIVNIVADESVLSDERKITLSKFFPITYDPSEHGYHVAISWLLFWDIMFWVNVSVMRLKTELN